MARKIGSVLISALCIALCAMPALADEPTETITLDLSNPYCSVGFYTDNNGVPGTLVQSSNYTNQSSQFRFPGSAYAGLPWARLSFTKQVPNEFSWSADYSYLATFVIYIGQYYSGSINNILTFPFFSDDDFVLTDSYNAWIGNRKILASDASSFASTYSYEPYTPTNSTGGRIETYSILFTFDDVSSLSSFRRLAVTATKNISFYGSDEGIQCWGWSLTAVYDPEGNISLQEPGVEDIIQGQRDAIREGQDNEYNTTEDKASEAADESQADASAAFNFSGFSGALSGLVSALGYTGTDFHFYLPAANNIPYLGNLWSQMEIPIKSMIDAIPVSVLYVLRFIAWLALLFSVVHNIKLLINDINGGGED